MSDHFAHSVSLEPHELKQKPARRWLEANYAPDECLVYVGIDWSESHRIEAIERNYLPYKVIAPLLEPPYVDKDELIAQANAEAVRM